MILGKRLLISTILVALPAAGPASAAPWVRSFVVGSYEYAFRYGGDELVIIHRANGRSPIQLAERVLHGWRLLNPTTTPSPLRGWSERPSMR